MNTQTAAVGDNPPAEIRERPPASVYGPVAWMRANLFNGIFSTIVTLVLGGLILWAAYGIVQWAFVNAVWSVPKTATGAPDPTTCRLNHGIGACWAAISDKWRFMLFGRYPYDQQWRAGLSIILFLGLFYVSADRRFWSKILIPIWVVTLIAIFTLMWGGILGLRYVPQDEWGGLPITLILSTFGLALAFPLAVFVALGRRSTRLPAVKILCVTYVELIRGVPLVALLFMANVMLPLFLPEGINLDKLLRAQVAIILFAAAYLAEVVRGGLQALPKGQAEAADALGLTYWQKTFKITLPQALRLVIPPLVNTFIGFFKDTSLVLTIGILDLLTSSKTAMSDPVWQGTSTEIYIVIAIIYFAFCYTMSSYSRGVERKLDAGRNR
jgi:general L-amino acid transport system permease protein